MSRAPMLPPIVLADTSNPDLPWCRLDLIDPADAVDFLAGTTNRAGAASARPWYSCSIDDLIIAQRENEAREEVATELLVAAIAQGRVRCAYVQKSTGGHQWKRSNLQEEALWIVDRAQFSGYVEHSWDGGLELTAYAEGYDYGCEISGFLLVWDDVLALVQTTTDDGAEKDPSFEPSKPSPSSRVGASETETFPGTKERRGSQSRRAPGRKVIPHGEPIALLTLALLAMPMGEFKKVTGLSAAADLRLYYDGCAKGIPGEETLETLAQGALRAVRNSRAEAPEVL